MLTQDNPPCGRFPTASTPPANLRPSGLWAGSAPRCPLGEALPDLTTGRPPGRLFNSTGHSPSRPPEPRPGKRGRQSTRNRRTGGRNDRRQGPLTSTLLDVRHRLDCSRRHSIQSRPPPCLLGGLAGTALQPIYDRESSARRD